MRKIKPSSKTKVRIITKGEDIILTLKGPIDDSIQLGPFTELKAKEVVDLINK